ncbi:MAG: hypothetical protein B6U72_06010 [Candidatus Altiarchaeales archaeon ex4484_2]|nr:MAG: hypothetical protein B6U72_06010 [Candidatus Altiarchaeales archaeon ex4484_2]
MFSAQDSGFGIDVGDEYFFGDTVYVDVNAPDGATVNFSITAPDDSVESFFLMDIGSFTHLYLPSEVGFYCVSARVFYLVDILLSLSKKKALECGETNFIFKVLIDMLHA